jgi:hypothetical protein
VQLLQFVGGKLSPRGSVNNPAVIAAPGNQFLERNVDLLCLEAGSLELSDARWHRGEPFLVGVLELLSIY